MTEAEKQIRAALTDIAVYQECYDPASEHANAAIDGYLKATNPAVIQELLAEIDALRSDAAKSEMRVRMFGSIIHNHVLAMQCAIIEAHHKGHKEGLQWIFNTLWGPGQIPDIDAAIAMGGAQAYFDAETEKEEKRLAAIDAAIQDGEAL